MKKFLYILSTLLLSSGILAQNTTDNTFSIDKDNYSIKTTVTNDDNYGFTIEYKNYYKVVTNLFTKRSYCLVGGNLPRPQDCDPNSTFNTPISTFSVDNNYDTVVPFIELLDLQSKLIKTNTANITSPCINDGSTDTSTVTPQMTISPQTVQSVGYVDFSANQDVLTPIQKAAWIMYLATFFDLEDTAFAVYSQIVNNYECHRSNVASMSTNIPIAWTSYDPSLKMYTIFSQEYYQQLTRDAGGKLIYTNSAQPDVFNMTFSQDPFLMAQALHGADLIIDDSSVQVDWNTWKNGNSAYFPPNRFMNVSAVLNENVFSINGLINRNNASDWSQRAVARPDLALLEIIKHLYPSFSVPKNDMFPIWIRRFGEHQTINADIYGGCSNISSVAFEQTQCILGDYATTSTMTPKKMNTGEKAGISVGSVIFFILAVLFGVWAYRKYQRRKRRHNFYRMNEF